MDELQVPSYAEWMDAANTATDRLYDSVMGHLDDSVLCHLDDRTVRLYEVLSIASSLCAVAAAIKERK